MTFKDLRPMTENNHKPNSQVIGTKVSPVTVDFSNSLSDRNDSVYNQSNSHRQKSHYLTSLSGYISD